MRVRRPIVSLLALGALCAFAGHGHVARAHEDELLYTASLFQLLSEDHRVTVTALNAESWACGTTIGPASDIAAWWWSQPERFRLQNLDGGLSVANDINDGKAGVGQSNTGG